MPDMKRIPMAAIYLSAILTEIERAVNASRQITRISSEYKRQNLQEMPYHNYEFIVVLV